MVIDVIKNNEEIKRESLDIRGEINSRLRNPNSRSNIKGKPALMELVNAVKIIMPGLKKLPYFIFCANKPTGAF